MNTVIRAAATATEVCREEITTILDAAAGPHAINGFGIYVDRVSVMHDLITIRDAANTALALLVVTKWPSPTDYNEWRGP